MNKRRQTADRIAAFVVKAGGVGVVATVLLIGLFLVAEAVPLLKKPELGAPSEAQPLPKALAAGVEPFVEAAWLLREDGSFLLVDRKSGSTLEEQQPLELLEGERLVDAKVEVEQDGIAFASNLGRVGYLHFDFSVEYAKVEEGEELNREHSFDDLSARWLVESAGSEPLADFAVFDYEEDDDGYVAAALSEDGTVTVHRGLFVQEDIFDENLTFQLESRELPREDVTHVEYLEGGRLVVGHASGRCEAFDDELESLGAVEADSSGPIQLVQALIGRGSLLVARTDGAIERFFLEPATSGPPRLSKALSFSDKLPSLVGMGASPRQHVFIAVTDDEVAIGQATAGAILSRAELPAAGHWAISPREDHLVGFTAGGELILQPIDLGYPAASFRTLFTKVRYEGLPGESHTWQSTGGTDAYEPKTSLVPLVIGTFKGTFWALLPSIPLAVFGALYCARFLSVRTRRLVKPFVELLAGIPSVILGFVGALYIAPALLDRMLALFFLPAFLIAECLVAGALWARMPLRVRRRYSDGRAPVVLLPIFALTAWAVLSIGPGFEQALLGAPFHEWAYSTLGLPFEHKNSLIVGLAMGFAVTPLIFTLAEDAYQNVPKELGDASLALGATAWQTARRVISPAARPGVVSAVMLGLGRAVGETMIVLMATGNTAVTSWNPLQGFRTLSANLATELPEAPHGESLYRVLFLSAVILFIFTFAVNTVAEVIRSRGRRTL